MMTIDVKKLHGFVPEKELQLQNQLIDAGVKLLAPSPSTDELLAALDQAEEILSHVCQGPSSFIEDGLLPSVEALKSDRLLRHPSMDVKISVLSCICEVLRISAPDQPYEDERMKEIFQLTLLAFEKLSLFSGRCYAKALRILEIFAKVRCCVILLDIGCDSLVTKIFEALLSHIKLTHPGAVFSNMEAIMTCLLEESDDISLDLLKPILASVKKENQITSLVSSWLGERVLLNCSAKVRPHLIKAVKLMALDLNDYANTVAYLCRDMAAGDNEVMMEAEENASCRVQAEADLPRSLLHDDNRSKDEIEHLKSMAKEPVAHEPLESGGEILARAGVVEPNRIVRESNPPLELEKDHEHSVMSGGPNPLEIPLEIPHKCENRGKVSSSSHNSSAEKLHFHPERENETELISFQPKTSRSYSKPSPISRDQSDEGKSLHRRGSSKKKGSIINQDNSFDGHLRRGSCGTKDAEENSEKYSRRKSTAVKNNMERTAGVKNRIVKKEIDSQSDSEGKPIILYKLKDGRKRTEQKTQRSEGSKKPRIAKEFGEEIVGSRIKVWWPMDRQFYEGVIESFDPSKKKHKVSYVDGDEEILNLKKEHWFLPEDQEKGSSIPSSAATAVRSRKRGRKHAGRKSGRRCAVDILHIKTELDVLANDDEETKNEEENLRSETLTDASKSSNN